MKSNNKIVAITTVRQGDIQNVINKVRADVFLDTSNNLRNLKIPCIAIFTDCTSDYINKLKMAEVILIEQNSNGMGNIRREALRA